MARLLQQILSFHRPILQQRQLYSSSDTQLQKRRVTLMYKCSTLFLALIAALALSACGFEAAPEPPADVRGSGAAGSAPTDGSDTGSAPTAESNANVTITFGADSFMRHVYEPLIAAFNAQHPGITVQWVSLDQVYRAGGDH